MASYWGGVRSSGYNPRSKDCGSRVVNQVYIHQVEMEEAKGGPGSMVPRAGV